MHRDPLDQLLPGIICRGGASPPRRSILPEHSDFAPLHVGDPSKAIFRIYRDTRFSKDKTPYKTHIAAVFPRRGAGKDAASGYYFWRRGLLGTIVTGMLVLVPLKLGLGW